MRLLTTSTSKDDENVEDFYRIKVVIRLNAYNMNRSSNPKHNLTLNKHFQLDLLNPYIRSNWLKNVSNILLYEGLKKKLGKVSFVICHVQSNIPNRWNSSLSTNTLIILSCDEFRNESVIWTQISHRILYNKTLECHFLATFQHSFNYFPLSMQKVSIWRNVISFQMLKFNWFYILWRDAPIFQISIHCD